MKKVKTNKRRIVRNKKHMRKSQKVMRGGCACGSAVHMTGGFGPASYSAGSLPSTSYYSLNNYANDPNNSSTMMSSRNLPNMVGGKRQKKCKKCGKMYRGGSFNGVSSFGTTSGGIDLLSRSNNMVNPAPYDQPAARIINNLV